MNVRKIFISLVLLLVVYSSSYVNAAEEELGYRYMKEGKYEEAIEWFKEKIKANPHYSANYSSIGEVCTRKGYHKEAIKWFKEAIKVDPHVSANYVNIGRLYRAEGNYEQAIKWLREGIRVNPHDSSNYAGIGRVYISKGNYEEAIKWFREGINADPHYSDNYAGIGEFYAHEGKYEEASKWLKEGIKADPSSSANYTELGKLYIVAGKYPEALKWLGKAKELCIDRECDPVYEQLGRAYMAIGQYEEADKTLSHVVDGKDIHYFGYWGCPFQALGELYSHMAINDQKRKVLDNYMKAADVEYTKSYAQFEAARICYEYGDYENAMRYIERAFLCQDHSKEPNKYQLLKGFILINIKRYSEAEQILNAIVRTRPGIEGAIAKVGLGHIEIAMKNYELASIYFEEMLKIDRADPMANLGMAWVSSNQNKHQEAVSYYDAIAANTPSRILGLHPPQILVLLGKGNALMGLKRIDEAKEIFEKVLMIEPDNEYALVELGMVLYNKQEDTRAEELFKQALKINRASYSCPYEGLGLLYLRAGKTRDAEANFEKAIQVNPSIEYKKYNGLAKIYLKEGRYKEAKELLEKSIKNYPYDGEAKELLNKIE